MPFKTEMGVPRAWKLLAGCLARLSKTLTCKQEGHGAKCNSIVDDEPGC